MPNNHSHLTTEQLSAFLDQQLSAQEQSLCQAHLITCDSCQQHLAELQQTVRLVRALPRAPLPRSFVLPIESTIQNSEVAGQDTSIPKRRRLAHNRILVGPRYVHTTMRVTSALVAVLGLFFILSGLLTIVSPNAGTSQVATSFIISRKIRAPHPPPNTNQEPQFAGARPLSPSVPQPQAPVAITAPSLPQPPAIAGGAPSAPLPMPSAEPPIAQSPGPSPRTSQQQPPRVLFNLDTSEKQLSLGLLLFIAGMVSVIVLTRLGKPAREQ